MGSLPPPGPVYGIADLGVLGEEGVAPAVEAMAEAGIRWIQVRAKGAPAAKVCAFLEKSVRALEGSEAVLWLDDRADLAGLFPITGVHVGQRDLPPGAVRKVLGEEVAIGCSTHDRGQVEAAVADGAVDVIAVGPVFATTSKEKADPVVGLELLQWARQRTTKPLVAIGGIDAESLPRVLAAGADTVALIGALCRGDVRENCRRLVQAARGWA